MGEAAFWRRCQILLEGRIEHSHVPIDQLVGLIEVLSQRNFKSEPIWKHVSQQVAFHLKAQTFNYAECTELVHHLGLRVPLCEVIAEYLVSKGYDSEELGDLGLKRAFRFIQDMSLSLDPDRK